MTFSVLNVELKCVRENTGRDVSEAGQAPGSSKYGIRSGWSLVQARGKAAPLFRWLNLGLIDLNRPMPGPVRGEPVTDIAGPVEIFRDSIEYDRRRET